jgi:hypothetical protein
LDCIREKTIYIVARLGEHSRDLAYFDEYESAKEYQNALRELQIPVTRYGISTGDLQSYKPGSQGLCKLIREDSKHEKRFLTKDMS